MTSNHSNQHKVSMDAFKGKVTSLKRRITITTQQKTDAHSTTPLTSVQAMVYHENATKLMAFNDSLHEEIFQILTDENEIENVDEVKSHEHERLLIIPLILISSLLILYQYHSGFLENVSYHCQKSSETIANNITLKKTPPVVVRPPPGLGNQLFQYACAYSLAKQRNSDLYLCIESQERQNKIQMLLSFIEKLNSLHISNTPRHNLLFRTANSSCMSQLAKISKTEIFYTTEKDIIMEKYPSDEILLTHGYMESEIFFKHYKQDILQMFSLEQELEKRVKIHSLSSQIIQSETESVAIHVRRGDFEKVDGGRVLPMDYYSRAIKLIKTKIAEKVSNKNITFFVFSDDIKKVKEELKSITPIYNNFVFVSNGILSREDDFILMSLCKHIIVANSTFSWWAAYLNRNQDKIVIAPSPKFKPDWYKKVRNQKFLMQIYGGIWTYPYEWITIDPYVQLEKIA